MSSHTNVVILHTNHGDININLFPTQAPKTVDNRKPIAATR